jgi:hypothetical protein
MGNVNILRLKVKQFMRCRQRMQILPSQLMKQTLKVLANQRIMELQNLFRRRLEKQGDGRMYEKIYILLL